MSGTVGPPQDWNLVIIPDLAQFLNGYPLWLIAMLCSRSVTFWTHYQHLTTPIISITNITTIIPTTPIISVTTISPTHHPYHPYHYHHPYSPCHYHHPISPTNTNTIFTCVTPPLPPTYQPCYLCHYQNPITITTVRKTDDYSFPAETVQDAQTSAAQQYEVERQQYAANMQMLQAEVAELRTKLGHDGEGSGLSGSVVSAMSAVTNAVRRNTNSAPLPSSAAEMTEDEALEISMKKVRNYIFSLRERRLRTMVPR